MSKSHKDSSCAATTGKDESQVSDAVTTTTTTATSAAAGAFVPAFRLVHASWDAFDADLKEYCQATYQLYVVRSTTSVPRRNKRISTRLAASPTATAAATHAPASTDPKACSASNVRADTTHGADASACSTGENQSTALGESEASSMIPDHFRWYSKSLVCTHGWKERHRSKGKRAVIAVRSTCCPAKMSVILQRNGDHTWQVVVTKHVRTHNHPLSKELFYHYCGNRRIFSPELLGVQGTNSRDGDELLGDDEDEPEREETRPLVANENGNGTTKRHHQIGDDKSDHGDDTEEDVVMHEEQASAPSNTFCATILHANSCLVTPLDPTTSEPVAPTKEQQSSSTITVSPGSQVAAPSPATTAVAISVAKMPKEHETWESFHSCFLDYTLRTNQQFRIRSTVSSAFQNSKLKEHSKRNAYDQVFVIPLTIKWFSKLYCCNHGWKRKSRSKARHLDLRGLNHSERGMGHDDTKPCPAMLLARVHCGLNGLWRVMVDRQHNVHNHLLEPSEQCGDHDGIDDGMEATAENEDDESSEQDGQVHKPTNSTKSMDQGDVLVQHAMTASSLITSGQLLQAASQMVNDLAQRSLLHEGESLAMFDKDHDGINGRGEIVMRVPRIKTYHESWDAFHKFLEEYSAATFQSYRTRTTTSVRARNHRVCGGKDGRAMELDDTDHDELQPRITDAEVASSSETKAHEECRVIPESLRWYSKTMTCTHGWKERRRGTGKRVVQAIRSTECPVKICATLQYMFSMPKSTRAGNSSIEFDAQIGPGWRVVVTKHLCDHNHNISKELYQHYRENRRIYDPELLTIDESNEANIVRSRDSSNDAAGEGSTPPSQQDSHDESLMTNNVLLPATTEGVQSSLLSTESSDGIPMGTTIPASSQATTTQVTAAPSVAMTSESLVTNSGVTPYPAFLPSGVKAIATIGVDPAVQPPPQQLLRQQMFSPERDFDGSSPSRMNSSSSPTGPNASLMMASPYMVQTDALTSGVLQSVMNNGTSCGSSAALGASTGATCGAVGVVTQIPSTGIPALPPNVQELPVEATDGSVITMKSTSDGSPVWIVPHMQRKHDSWDNFEKYLSKYSAATFQMYRIRTTSSIAVRNARVYQKAAKRQIEIHQGSHLDLQLIPDSFVYYSKTYVCTHGWKERRRGKGKRVCHSLRSTSCPVKACVTLQRDLQHAFKWSLVVTKHVVEHNHELSEEIYQQYSENRRVNDPELLAKVEQFWRSGMSRRRIYEYLVEHSTKKVRMKDVHNLIHRWQNQRSGGNSNGDAEVDEGEEDRDEGDDEDDDVEDEHDDDHKHDETEEDLSKAATTSSSNARSLVDHLPPQRQQQVQAQAPQLLASSEISLEDMQM